MGTIVKALDNFNIDIYKLSNARHDYRFEIGNSFFEAFPDGLVDKGSGRVDVELTKSETLITLTFNLNIKVKLVCDRSLESFDYPMNLTKGLILKYGDEEQELDDEMIMIKRETQRINLAQYIYEFIGLNIPMKKLHPKFDDEDDQDELIYSSKEEKNENKTIDPRWQALKKLK